MLLETILSESATGFGFAPTEEYLSGDDFGGEILCSENAAAYNELDEQLLLAESMIYAKSQGSKIKAQGEENLSEAVAAIDESVRNLSEATAKEYGKKLKETLVKAWEKFKNWLSNLIKSISILVTNVNKSLDGVEEILKEKDLSKITYVGYNWKNSNMPTQIANNASKAVTEALNNKSADKKAALRSSTGTLLGLKGELSKEQAMTRVKESYGAAKKANMTLSAGSVNTMISYLKDFDKNEALKTLKDDMNKMYKEVVDKASTAAEGDESVTANISAASKAINEATSLLNKCMSLEKMRFSEYRGLVAKAVRS